jgi:hypothetical protein
VYSFLHPESRSVARYSEFRAGFGKCASSFPESIPKSATHVEVVCFPGILQAGPRLEIRYWLPKADAKSLVESIPESQTLGNTQCEWAKSILADEWIRPGGARRLEELHDPWRVFVFHTSGSWNHPHIGGVAIDTESGEVIYFAEGG